MFRRGRGWRGCGKRSKPSRDRKEAVCDEARKPRRRWWKQETAGLEVADDFSMRCRSRNVKTEVAEALGARLGCKRGKSSIESIRFRAATGPPPFFAVDGFIAHRFLTVAPRFGTYSTLSKISKQ